MHDSYGLKCRLNIEPLSILGEILDKNTVTVISLNEENIKVPLVILCGRD